MTTRRWIEYLIAVLTGNAIYFWVLLPGLPLRFQHQPFAIDLGLALDFLCCVLVYAAIRLGARHAERWRSGLSATEKRRSEPNRTGSSRSQTDAPSGSRRAG